MTSTLKSRYLNHLCDVAILNSFSSTMKKLKMRKVQILSIAKVNKNCNKVAEIIANQLNTS